MTRTNTPFSANATILSAFWLAGAKRRVSEGERVYISPDNAPTLSYVYAESSDGFKFPLYHNNFVLDSSGAPAPAPIPAPAPSLTYASLLAEIDARPTLPLASLKRGALCKR